MKRILFACIMTLCLHTADAASYPYMVFRAKNGAETTVSTTGLRLEVSADGKLTARSADGDVTFAMADLSSMAFVEGPSGLAAIFAPDSRVELFTLDGVALGAFDSLDAARQAVATSGIYVCKSNGGNAKIYLSK